MKFKIVLFDLGSTLIEFENHDWQTLGKMGIANAYPYMKKLFPDLPGLEQFGETFYSHFRHILDTERSDYSEIDLYQTFLKIFRRTGLAVQDGIIERFVGLYYEPVTQQVTLIDGAPEILKTINDTGLRIGLISNSIFPEKHHRQEMERFGLLEYFDFTIFSSTVGIRKPKREIFEMGLEKAGAQASQAVFVGDRFDIDIMGAQNAGLTAILKYREGRENPGNVKPDFSIVNLDELKTIIL